MRFGTVEDSLKEILKRLDKRPVDDYEVDPRSRASESANHYNQVPSRSSESYRNNNSLGYRSGSGDLNLTSRDKMLKKIEMPSCDGLRVTDWLVDIEHFFTVGRFHDTERLDLIPLCVEGRVKKWFVWVLRRDGFRDWLDFKQRLIQHFTESIDDEPSTKLFSIRQTGSAADYVSEFEELSAQVPGIEDRHLERLFYTGLNQEMKEVIKMKEPQGLPNFIAAVLRMEKSAFCKVVSKVSPEEVTGATKTSSTYKSNKSNTGGRVWDKQRMETGHNKENGGDQQTSQRPRLKFTDAELDAMRRDRICFKCKGPWSKSHECPNREIRVMTVIHGIEMEVLDSDDEVLQEVDQNVCREIRTLSMNSFLGIDSPKTTKLRGRINQRELVFMLDSGASHNFISPTVNCD